MGLKRKVSGVEETHFRAWNVTLERIPSTSALPEWMLFMNGPVVVSVTA
jgi:hypothetical protein